MTFILKWMKRTKEFSIVFLGKCYMFLVLHNDFTATRVPLTHHLLGDTTGIEGEMRQTTGRMISGIYNVLYTISLT